MLWLTTCAEVRRKPGFELFPIALFFHSSLNCFCRCFFSLTTLWMLPRRDLKMHPVIPILKPYPVYCHCTMVDYSLLLFDHNPTYIIFCQSSAKKRKSKLHYMARSMWTLAVWPDLCVGQSSSWMPNKINFFTFVLFSLEILLLTLIVPSVHIGYEDTPSDLNWSDEHEHSSVKIDLNVRRHFGLRLLVMPLGTESQTNTHLLLATGSLYAIAYYDSIVMTTVWFRKKHNQCTNIYINSQYIQNIVLCIELSKCITIKYF